jgi:hypothetical protein
MSDKELIEQLAKLQRYMYQSMHTNGAPKGFYISADGDYLRYEDVLKMLEAYAQTQGQSKWIDSNVTPCPDDGKSYWLFDRETGFMAIQSDWSVNTDEFNLQWIDGKEPSHWMPLTLPAAPIESGVKG